WLWLWGIRTAREPQLPRLSCPCPSDGIGCRRPWISQGRVPSRRSSPLFVARPGSPTESHMSRRAQYARLLTLTQLEDPLNPVGGLSEQIVVDQFGWRASAQKVVVFADPVDGQNGSISYTPGTSFQLRRTSDDAIVFTGSVVQWNNGAVHTQSGDRAWQ